MKASKRGGADGDRETLWLVEDDIEDVGLATRPDPPEEATIVIIHSKLLHSFQSFDALTVLELEPRWIASASNATCRISSTS